jgi:hypothetical protein
MALRGRAALWLKLSDRADPVLHTWAVHRSPGQFTSTCYFPHAEYYAPSQDKCGKGLPNCKRDEMQMDGDSDQLRPAAIRNLYHWSHRRAGHYPSSVASWQLELVAELASYRATRDRGRPSELRIDCPESRSCCCPKEVRCEASRYIKYSSSRGAR